MKCYSLINGYYSIGIYTSLDNLYVALKSSITKILKEWPYSREEIETWYEIKEVVLDNEPLECYEFSTYGKEVVIDWDRIF